MKSIKKFFVFALVLVMVFQVSAFAAPATAEAKTTGSDVIAYAKKFIGNPYRTGGTSLTHGADCSGYVLAVYKHFGYSLPHSSYAMRSCGKKVKSLSAAKPGDIICYSGHVAIYMGNGKMIHAANPRKGICTSKYIHYSRIITIRRIIK